MSATAFSDVPSTLSAYGYDFVLAVTQDSINATMSEFVSEISQPIVYGCYVVNGFDSNNQPIPLYISHDDLLKKTNGIDPFLLPAASNTSSDPRYGALQTAQFMFGFRAQIGVPRVKPGVPLPQWVTFPDQNANTCDFNMMCSTFQVVQYTPGGWGSASFMNTSQTSDQPWIFQASVDLAFDTVPPNNEDPSNPYGYANLPQSVKNQIMNLGAGAFTVQQLLFDLTTPTLMKGGISASTLNTNMNVLLDTYFGGLYFQQMRTAGQPLLSVTVASQATPAWSLKPTSLYLTVDQYKPAASQQANPGMSTLNYLCAVGGKTLPAAQQFPWNWVDASQESDHDGVVSINRDSLVAWFQEKLLPIAQQNCYNIHVTVTASGNTITYSFPMTPGQTPTVALNKGTDGSTVLTYTYTNPTAYNSDEAGLNGDLGSMKMTQTYSMVVQFSGTEIIITQRLVVWANISKNLTSDSGNLVDRTSVGTYAIGVDTQGSLQAVLNPPEGVYTINDMNPKSNAFTNWFTDINSIIATVEGYVRALASTSFQSIPVAVVQDFIFPGGKAFTYKEAAFSKNLDLVAKITYADPAGTN